MCIWGSHAPGPRGHSANAAPCGAPHGDRRRGNSSTVYPRPPATGLLPGPWLLRGLQTFPGSEKTLGRERPARSRRTRVCGHLTEEGRRLRPRPQLADQHGGCRPPTRPPWAGRESASKTQGSDAPPKPPMTVTDDSDEGEGGSPLTAQEAGPWASQLLLGIQGPEMPPDVCKGSTAGLCRLKLPQEIPHILSLDNRFLRRLPIPTLSLA